jgi:hypothetical protein
MRFEETASRAGRDLQNAVHADVEAALAELRVAAPRRRRARVAGTLCAAAVILALGAGAVAWWGTPTAQRGQQPADQPRSSSPTPSSATTKTGTGCRFPRVTCLGQRRVTIAMTVPVTWTVPRGFKVPYSGQPPGPTMAETYLLDEQGGVTVVEDVRAATGGAAPRPVGDVTTADSLAQWIAQRPFLDASDPRPTTVDGIAAWTVEATVKAGRGPGPAQCSTSIPCFPVVLTGPQLIGTWSEVVSRYTVLDLPGAGMTLVWSWGLDRAVPAAAQSLVDSIRFG